MSVLISEALKLSTLSHFKLLSGGNGLNKKIDKVGILDYEIIEDNQNQFVPGDFVLSCFTVARNDEQLMIKSIKKLIGNGVSGLAIKNIYYTSIPDEIVELSNRANFPIFLFDNRVYFEDIITEIMDSIKLKGNEEIIESKLKILETTKLKPFSVKELAYELNPFFKDKFQVFYCKEKSYRTNDNIIKLINRNHRNLVNMKYHSIFKYGQGILIIMTYGDSETIKKNSFTLQDFGISTSFYVGISSVYSSLGSFNAAIKESIYSVYAGILTKKDIIDYKDIGIYKFLLPLADDEWSVNYYKEIIEKLNLHDIKHNSNLLITAITYIEENGNINNTAKRLFQHGNTVRYRIDKIAALINNTTSDFYEELSITIKLHKISLLKASSF